MSLSEISNKMVQASPVFIVGERRSGSSILYRTLLKHSAFRPKTMTLEETFIFLFANRSFRFRKDHMRCSQLLRYMLDDQVRYEQFLTSIQSIQLLHRLLIGPISGRLADRLLPLWFVGLNHLVVRSFFYYAWEARKCRRIIEKTPLNLPHIPKIFIAFPKSKILYIYRHPVDVFSSYRKRLQIGLNSGEEINRDHWLRRAPKCFCKTYRIAIDIALNEVSNRSRSVFLVKYEAFVKQPKEEFSKICEFLGETFEKEAMEEQNPDLSRWKADPHLFGSIVSKTKNWQDFVALGDAKYIEHELESTMRTLGYQSYTNYW